MRASLYGVVRRKVPGQTVTPSAERAREGKGRRNDSCAVQYSCLPKGSDDQTSATQNNIQ